MIGASQYPSKSTNCNPVSRPARFAGGGGRWVTMLLACAALLAVPTPTPTQNADNVAPVFVSARTDGGYVTITFSKEIFISPLVRYVKEWSGAPLQLFLKAAFDVSINGRVIFLHDDISLSGTELTLQMAFYAGSGDEVRVAYNNIFVRNAGGLLVDAAGNAVPYFSYQTVQNNAGSAGSNLVDGAVLNPGEITIAEGSSGTYTVKLASQPSENVTVNVMPYAIVQVTPAQLTFTPDNWDAPQTVTVSTYDDDDSVDAWAAVLHQIVGDNNANWTFIKVVVDDQDPPLVVSGNTSTSYTENGTSSVATYSVTNAGGTTVSYKLYGDDKSDFSISNAGVLTFKRPPDHENPADSNGDNVYRVTIHASNGTSTGALLDVAINVTDEEPPSPPSAPTVSAVSASAVKASWTAPANTGSAITDYDYRYRAVADPPKSWTEVTGTTITVLEAEITGLEADTEYEVQVRATSDGETSDWSASGKGSTTAKPAVTLVLRPSSIGENSGVSTISATLSGASSVETSVTVSVEAVSPAISGDFTLSANRTLRIAAGQRTSTGTVTITANNNDVDAPDKTVRVSATASTTEVSEPTDVELTITDDDDRGVEVSKAVLNVPEEGSETYTMVLTSEPTDNVTVTVAGASGDVSVRGSSLVFTTLNWGTQKTVTVDAADDTDALADTPVTLSHTVRGGDYSGISADAVEVTIIENDAPTLTIEDMRAVEGAGMMTFEVRLSLATSNEATVNYATSNGTARAGTDYTHKSGTLTFPPNNTTPQEIRVPIINDDEDDAIEEKMFSLTLSGASNASLAGGGATLTATGTIEDDDEPEVEVSFDQTSYTVNEGGTVTVRVHLSTDPERRVTVPLATTNQNDVTLDDYSGVPQSVTFNPGQTSRTFTVTAEDDALDEDDETVALGFGTLPPRVTRGRSATVNLIDNDGPSPPPPSPPSPPPSPSPSPPPSPPPPPPPSPPPSPPPLPLSPDAPVVTKALATSMVVRWQAPEGAVISSYDLRYRQSGTTDFIEGPQDVIGTRAIITGLSPDTEYEIQVRASNSTGDGDWSELGAVRTNTLISQDRFSFSLDMDDAEGDQFTSFRAASPDGGRATIQIFGKGLKAIPVNDLSVRFEYDATQVVYEGFKRGPVLSGTSALGSKDFVNIGMTLSDSETRDERGLMGTIRFRATDAISETEIRLVRVKLLRGGQSETTPMFLSVALQGSSPGLPISGSSPDFDGNGTVDIPDFLLFVDVFGLKEGQEGYEAKYDLDDNDVIGIPDFLIFVDNFGKEVRHVPVFTSEGPVIRFLEENTPPGQPIGDPISATSADGEPLTYSLWGVDADYFTIDASTGQLETRETYNFEERNWYSPIVRVSDSNGGHVSVVVGIAIIDVAE